MGVRQMLTGDYLTWDLMKFCQGFKASEIEIYTIRDGNHKETLLSHWEGKFKSEKLKTLADIIEIKLYDEIDIVLPNGRVYEH